ncbi:MAG: polysaccharide deacetylase family protein [Candidatus Saganbacteria bacterium]|nr:polysaccharide deacetylase family protein [Candidatus Saganbacteria bacterium]
MKKFLFALVFFAVALLIVFSFLRYIQAISVTETTATTSTTTTLVSRFSFKRFPVLEYHLVSCPEARWSRTPENFRSDLEWLYVNNYYPVNLRDILDDFPGLPQGKTPVVLTFDDSSSSQFRYLADGTLDPDCAVGIIKAFHDQHPDWPMRATFFIVIGTNNPDRNIFGQKELREKKLKQLTGWGMEVASHTYWHDRLNKCDEKFCRYTLSKSYQELKDLSGQEIVSLATPMGLYPSNEAVFSGQYQSIKYDYKLVCEVAGGLQPVPGSPRFNPYHINRIQTIWPEWEKFFNRREY